MRDKLVISALFAGLFAVAASDTAAGFCARAAVAAPLAKAGIISNVTAIRFSMPYTRVLHVVTLEGNEYIAGAGDTCVDAWKGAQIPAHWDTIDCR